MQIDPESCSVRSFRDSDAAELAAHANNRRVWRQLRDRFPILTRPTMHAGSSRSPAAPIPRRRSR